MTLAPEKVGVYNPRLETRLSLPIRAQGVGWGANA